MCARVCVYWCRGSSLGRTHVRVKTSTPFECHHRRPPSTLSQLPTEFCPARVSTTAGPPRALSPAFVQSGRALTSPRSSSACAASAAPGPRRPSAKTRLTRPAKRRRIKRTPSRSRPTTSHPPVRALLAILIFPLSGRDAPLSRPRTMNGVLSPFVQPPNRTQI